jgi:hypothetical protein
VIVFIITAGYALAELMGITTGSRYDLADPAVISFTSSLRQSLTRWQLVTYHWQLVTYHRQCCGRSGGDDGDNNIGSAYHSVAMMGQQHRLSIPSGGDDRDNCVGAVYHPAAMTRTTASVRRTIRRRWMRHQRRFGL